jgi:bacillolysin
MKHVYTLCLTMGITLCSFAQAPQKSDSKDFIKLETTTSRQPAQQLLKEQLKMNEQEEMRSLKTEEDNLGFSHQKFQHYYKGLKVEGSTYTIHSKNGAASHMTGNYREVDNIQTTASLSDFQALEFAKSATNATVFAWENGG